MKRFILTVLAIAAAPAWAAKTVALVPGDVEQVTSLDEVIVEGDRTLSAARKAVEEAEDRFHARWNEINSDRKYDIRCDPYTPTGTHFTYRYCRPAFEDDMEMQAAQAFLWGIQGAKSGAGAVVAMPAANPMRVLMLAELKKRTLAMVNKDPELKRALIERARLQQHYEDLRKEKFRNHWIVWD